ncbi:hypothetical protein AB0420_02240 [Streptomyces caelestis]|uniref:hypothetical protein n=1 Tax=Streptomyces caelestis TaxID=36816 RepID=UPI0034506FEA
MHDDETPWRSEDYIEPIDRPAAWGEMAASLARDGFGPEEIATMLCVDEPTVARLLAGAR